MKECTGEFARAPKEKLFQNGCFQKSKDFTVNYTDALFKAWIVGGGSVSGHKMV